MSNRPKSGSCAGCDEIFDYHTVPQGGSKRPKYCSAACRTRTWARQKMLHKYNWTEQGFKSQLERQHGACAGCLRPFGPTLKPGIDHCHKSGRPRGLLCNPCNSALGMVQDNPMTMRRLMSYLERDINKRLLYLAGSLRNPRVFEVGNILRGLNWDVMDEWATPGEKADDSWQEYETKRGRSYGEALQGRAATNIFMFDRSYLDLSDVVVVLMPAGKSAMLEAGYAKGRGKKVAICFDGIEPERFDVMPQFADRVFASVHDLVLWLGNLK